MNALKFAGGMTLATAPAGISAVVLMVFLGPLQTLCIIAGFTLVCLCI